MRWVLAGAVLPATLIVACGRTRGVSERIPAGGVATVRAPSTTAPGAPRAGMIWIPAGVLHAGSEIDDVPRVAEAELPGLDIPMGGIYIDALPWPNEAGAIATVNVSRDEAARLCDEKGKRLCTELEWERACKGPDNSRFEYGASYDAHVCGAGASAETASQHPSGQRPLCRSAFGVREMHGGPSEWTDSRWGRGLSRDLGVVRGGSDAPGEVVTRCAFGRSLSPGDRSASIGFRCCAGPRNEAEVSLDIKKGPPFERAARPSRSPPPVDALGGAACGPPSSPGACSFVRAWTWRPTWNVELSLSGGCVGRDPTARCGFAVWRSLGDGAQTLAQVDTGSEIPEVVVVDPVGRKIRVRGASNRGVFFQDLAFYFGRIDVRAVP